MQGFSLAAAQLRHQSVEIAPVLLEGWEHVVFCYGGCLLQTQPVVEKPHYIAAGWAEVAPNEWDELFYAVFVWFHFTSLQLESLAFVIVRPIIAIYHPKKTQAALFLLGKRTLIFYHIFKQKSRGKSTNEREFFKPSRRWGLRAVAGMDFAFSS